MALYQGSVSIGVGEKPLYKYVNASVGEMLGVIDAEIAAITPDDIGAQSTLTFDTTPTANSTNPVTSSGIKNYVDSSFVCASEDDIISLF